MATVVAGEEGQPPRQPKRFRRRAGYHLAVHGGDAQRIPLAHQAFEQGVQPFGDGHGITRRVIVHRSVDQLRETIPFSNSGLVRPGIANLRGRAAGEQRHRIEGSAVRVEAGDAQHPAGHGGVAGEFRRHLDRGLISRNPGFDEIE